MKKLTKLLSIIAVGAVIAAGLSACGSLFSIKPAEYSEEELALQNAMDNASWEVKTLNNQPSFNGFEKLSGFSNELARFHSISSKNRLADDTWYELTAPELPGIS
jgi:hypothetical protein